ncbi:MAG: hypothetical protein ACLVI9_17110 [Anaerostipes hadrus]
MIHQKNEPRYPYPINGIRGMATFAKHHLGEDDKEEDILIRS